MIPLVLILTLAANSESALLQAGSQQSGTQDYSSLTEAMVTTDIEYRIKESQRLHDRAQAEREKLTVVLTRWQRTNAVARGTSAGSVALIAAADGAQEKALIGAFAAAFLFWAETQSDITSRKAVIDACNQVIRGRATIQEQAKLWELQRPFADFRRTYLAAVNTTWTPFINAAATCGIY